MLKASMNLDTIFFLWYMSQHRFIIASVTATPFVMSNPFVFSLCELCLWATSREQTAQSQSFMISLKMQVVQTKPFHSCHVVQLGCRYTQDACAAKVVDDYQAWTCATQSGITLAILQQELGCQVRG